MRRVRIVLMIHLFFASGGFAQVILGTTETFVKTAPTGAIWMHGPGDPLLGWQTAYINHDPTAVNVTPFWFGTDIEHHYGSSVDQHYPGSASGAVGSLLLQHDCCWGNSNDPSTGQPYPAASNYLVYISFNSTPSRVYSASAWVNTIENQVDPADPAMRDGIHPRVVNPALAGFPDLRIGLKNGQFDSGTDFAASWTPVTGLVDITWVKSPTIQLTATGTVMTVILQVKNPDTKCGAAIITDTWWDDVQVTELAPACPVPFADADSDGDVDQDDFAVFQRCYTGQQAGGPLSEQCRCLDHDQQGHADGLINEADLQAFSNCRTATGVLFSQHPNPNCANP